MSFRSLSCIVLFASVLVLVWGCASTRTITMDSIPDGADVELTSDEEQVPRSVGETPVDVAFRFGSGAPSLYFVKFMLEGYEPYTLRLDSDESRDNIIVDLKPEVVREIERLEIEVSDKGFKIEPRSVRAWVEDIEREGMGPSSIVRLGDFQSILGMTISPDGKTLVFSLAEVVKDVGGNERTVANLRSVQSRGGGGVTQITSGRWVDADPEFTPTGEYLLFASNRLRKTGVDIFRIVSDRTGGIGVVRQTTEGINHQPDTAGGDLMAFTFLPVYRGRLPAQRQIWTLGGPSGYPTQLREGSMPALSPDGKRIAYIGSDKQLWVMPINGQNPVQLTWTESPEGKRNPTWSPDGKYILYAGDEGRDSRNQSNYDIWMINADGTDSRQLTTNGSLDDLPVVSPDGRYIYFVSNRGFKEGIWRIPFPRTL
ncbi:MAG: hypothetical protein GF355_00035 [Candidatus Eisenbacteria bacterium]|nr:hypothetical protein [Candidatus Eisenbacteria bacterium]